MARSFLGLLFDSKPASNYILIWTKQAGVPNEKAQKLSKYFQSVDAATKYAEKVGSKAETYFGIGLASESLSFNQRVEAHKVAGVPGLWIDIDYLSPGVHKKRHLPANEAEALWLVESMPLEPSILIHSGHGFQAYWLFPKVIDTSVGESRFYLADLSERWQYYCKALASMKGWDVDSTFDLSRVFRVANTLNLKDTENPVKVEIRSTSEKRYAPDEIEAALEKASVTIGAPSIDATDRRATKRTLAASSDFKLDPDAEPPKAKFQALLDHEPNFKSSWEHKRTVGDGTPSSYDCSIATLAFNVGWSDQEIVDLCIAHRRKYDYDLKLRADYYRRTLAAAKTPGDRIKSVRKVERSAPTEGSKSTKREKKSKEQIDAENAGPEIVPSDDRETNLQVVSEGLGTEVTRIVKYLSDPPQYVICFKGGKEVEVKPIAFVSQAPMRMVIAVALNRNLAKIKTHAWEHLSDCMFAAIEEVEPGEETTHLGAVAHYLHKFLQSGYNPDLVDESQHDRALRGKPAHLAGSCCVDIDAMIRFAQTEFNLKLDKATVIQRLMRLGCTNQKRSLRKGQQVTSRKFWVIPDKFIEDHQLLVNAEAEILEGEKEEELRAN